MLPGKLISSSTCLDKISALLLLTRAGQALLVHRLIWLSNLVTGKALFERALWTIINKMRLLSSYCVTVPMVNWLICVIGWTIFHNLVISISRHKIYCMFVMWCSFVLNAPLSINSAISRRFGWVNLVLNIMHFSNVGVTKVVQFYHFGTNTQIWVWCLQLKE